jgi:hypothetical protein
LLKKLAIVPDLSELLSKNRNSKENYLNRRFRMLTNPYRRLLLFNFVVVLVVMALFRWIPSRQTASLFAGILFLLSPLLTLGTEWRRQRSLRSVPALTALFFLLVSALPIFLLRLCNWGTPFEELSLLGWTGRQMHQASNFIFFVMLGGLWWGSQSQKKINAGPDKQTK